MHVDFDAARAQRERTEGDPFTFTLGGEHFTCLATFPIGFLADLAQSGIGALPARDFIRGCLVPDDEERFDALLHRKARPVDPAKPDTAVVTDIIDGTDLLDVQNRLIEEFTGRPTAPPPDSPAGSPTSGQPSKDDFSLPDGGSTTS